MFCLGRLPSSEKETSQAKQVWWWGRPHINSVFPLGKNGVFEQICIVWSPEKTDLNAGSSGQWRWYTIHASSAKEIHAMVVPQPMGDVQSLRIIAQFPSSGQILAQINTGGGLERSRTLCKYSPESNSWATLPPMITPRDLLTFSGATIGDHLYVAGGLRQPKKKKKKKGTNFKWRRLTSKAERFDLTTCRWEALPDMHAGRSFAKGFALEGRFFVLHGLCDHRNMKCSTLLLIINSVLLIRVVFLFRKKGFKK